jgi:hypothetical protein
MKCIWYVITLYVMYLECNFVPNLAELNTLYVMYMVCYFVPNLAELI